MVQQVNFNGAGLMTICKDNTASSKQIITHIRKSETPMQDVKSLMLDILKQYLQADKMGSALGVMDKSASFTDAVSWCSIVSRLDHNKDTLDKGSKKHITESLDYLDNLVASFNEKVVFKIQKYRDKWMRRVLLWDLFAISLLLSSIFAVLFWSGKSFSGGIIFEFIQQRPLFSSISIIAVVAVLLLFHFIIRQKVIISMLGKNEEKLPAGMSLHKALTYNSRIQHSIFRPYPVGWSFLQRTRLKSIVAKLADLREQLADVMVSYPDKEAGAVVK